MRLPTRLSAVSAAIACLFAAQADAQAQPVPQARMTAAECEVWARETSFARSVAEHDAAAFAEHLHPDAAFGASRAEPARGRATIAQRWAAIIEGKAVTIEWYPTRTTIGGVGDVAWSSGPSLIVDLSPDAKQRHSIGAFHSVWHRDADGAWRVLFDDGVPGSAATDAQVAAFRQARPAACPQA